MPNPTKRHTLARTRTRRSHHALKPMMVGVCAQCGVAVKPHNACLSCGYYKNEEKVKVKKTLRKSA